MRIKKDIQDNKVVGYTLWLSENDVYSWAHNPAGIWPCSTLVGHRMRAVVDENGICDFDLDGGKNHDIDGTELDAIIGKHLPDDCKHLWPCWN